MSANIPDSVAPASLPAPPPSSLVPAVWSAPPMPLSEELGDQLQRLAEAQVAVDRRQAEKLGRLREIQNRD
ncbi:MAG TPA: hypothetical protein VEL76_02800 [Gemmataceae bacterium]|nr:hypothetical protein [Gemmataceae bacterium]